MVYLEEQTIEARYPSGWLLGVFLIASIAMLGGIVTGTLMTFVDATLIALLGFAVVTSVGTRIANDDDAAWLPRFIAMGYLAKIVASIARYLVLVVVYNGSGDASGYQGAGVRLAETWRSFQVPPDIDIGTTFVDALTGLLYVPYIPSMLGGFFLFSTLAFFGQMLMYAAFRKSAEPRRLKWYALALFFVPAVTYWPASIGKESLMFLGIGLALYGSSLFLRRGGIKPLLFLGAGLAFAGAIRPHMSALIVGSLAMTLVLARKKTSSELSSAQRFIAIIVVGAGSVFLVSFAAAEFNINLSGGSVGSDVNDFVTNLEDNTDKGGSSVDGGAVSSPTEIPSAALRVLFRPLPYEAHNLQAMASALESTAILLILLWRSPKIIKNLIRVRRDPYVLMSVIMTFGFVIMFSPFLNLGLLARERSQILPLLAVIIIQLGWDFHSKEEAEQGQFQSRRFQPTT